jgi:hypothetical protein
MTMLVGDKPSDDTFALFVVTGGCGTNYQKRAKKKKQLSSIYGN